MRLQHVTNIFQKKFRVYKMNMQCTFLHGVIEEIVFVEQTNRVCGCLGVDWTTAHYFSRRKTKTFAGARVCGRHHVWIVQRWCVQAFPHAHLLLTSQTRRFLILLLCRDFSVNWSSCKIDLEIHTGWISSLGEHSDSWQCMRQLQDYGFKFLISPIFVDI